MRRRRKAAACVLRGRFEHASGVLKIAIPQGSPKEARRKNPVKSMYRFSLKESFATKIEATGSLRES
jgi:hypothetical protein